jgi:hypothetical protein
MPIGVGEAFPISFEVGLDGPALPALLRYCSDGGPSSVRTHDVTCGLLRGRDSNSQPTG